MAFVRARAGWFPAKMRTPHAHPGLPTTSLPQASLGATRPTLEISGQVPRVPGLVTRETEALPATQRTTHFPVGHTSQQSPTPSEVECPGKK